jgi:hypothetical protein
LLCNSNDFIKKNDLLAFSLGLSENSSDITQGLPALESLINFKEESQKSRSSNSTGLLIKNNSVNLAKQGTLKNKIVSFYKNKKKKNKEINKNFYIKKLPFLNLPLIIFDNKLYKIAYKSSFQSYDKFHKKLKLNEGYLSLKSWKMKQKNCGSYFMPFKKKMISFTVRHEFFEDNKKNKLIFAKGNKVFLLKALNFCEEVNPLAESYLNANSSIINGGHFVKIGESYNNEKICYKNLIKTYYYEYSKNLNNFFGTCKALQKFQLNLLNSVIAIYAGEDIDVFIKHFEILVRQITAGTIIIDCGDTPFILGEYVSFQLISYIVKALSKLKNIYIPKIFPKYLSATKIMGIRNGHLASAAFSQIGPNLTKAAMTGKTDWMQGLKQNLMSGRIEPNGVSFLNYKNHLDNIYLFKNFF